MGLRNPKLAVESHIYSFEKLTAWLPKRLKPTDVDGAVERNKHFLFFEFKGQRYATLPTGQRIFWEHMLETLNGKGILTIVEHPPLSTAKAIVDPFHVDTTVRWWWWDRDEERVRRTVRIDANPATLTWVFDAWEVWTQGRRAPLENFVASHAIDN